MDACCRTCLGGADVSSSLFGAEAPTPADMLTALTSLKPTVGDGFPVRICKICLESVTNAFSFKLQAEKADAKLRIGMQIANQLSNIKQEENVVKIEQDEPNFHLDSYEIEDHFDPDNGDHYSESNSDSDDSKPLNELKGSTKNSPRKSNDDQANAVTFKSSRRTLFCKLCDRTFKYEKSLKKHLQNHITFEPFATINQKSRENFFEAHQELAGVNQDSLSDEYIIKLMIDDIKEERYEQYIGEVKVDPENAVDLPIQHFSSLSKISSSVKKKKMFSLKSKIKFGVARIRRKGRFHECSLCKRIFSRTNHLLRHMSTHDYDYPDKCSSCYWVFPNREMFMKHDQVKCKTLTKPFSCSACKMKFSDFAELKNHFTKRHKINSVKVDHTPLEDIVAEKLDQFMTDMGVEKLEPDTLNMNMSSCGNCNLSFVNEVALRDHIAQCRDDNDPTPALLDCKDDEIERMDVSVDFYPSDGSKEEKINIPKKIKKTGRHQCSLCSRFFSRSNHLIRHMSTHNFEYPDKCSICQKVFPNKDMLRKHSDQECENTPRVYKCGKCEILFENESLFNQHVLEQHEGESVSVSYIDPNVQNRGKPHPCLDCGKTFKRKEHLNTHLKYRSCLTKKYQCKICMRKFKAESYLISHSIIHNLQKGEDSKYHCTLCESAFVSPSGLVVHMRRHTGEKPFKCDICNKGFPRSSDLRCHSRTHTGEKPCLCSICGKGFSRANKLSRHMRIHLGLRPYKCTICTRAFTQSNDLQLHIRRHTGERPYVCEVCGLRFINGTALVVHRRTQGHNGPPANPENPDVKKPPQKKGRKSLKPKKLRKRYTVEDSSSEIDTTSEDWSSQDDV